MQKVLFEAARELTKGRELYVISSQLRREIQVYSMRNEFKTPKTVQNLYDFLYEKKNGFAYRPNSPDVWRGL